MHRAVNMKLGPSLSVFRLMVRRPASSNQAIGKLGCIAGCRQLQQQQPHQLRLLPISAGSLSPGPSSSFTIYRGICSTSPARKGRRGGASALISKRTRPTRRKTPGDGKKKKPKVHGAPMSRIYRERQLEEEAKKKIEAMAAIPPEQKARIHKMTEALLNTPMGQQDLGVNAHLRQKDPDAMLLDLGMALPGDASDNASSSIAPGTPSLPLHLEGNTPGNLGGLDNGFATDSVGEKAQLAENLEPVLELGSSGLPGAPLSGRPGSARDFNLLIRTLAAHGRGAEARERVVPEMRRRGVALNGRHYSALLAGAAVEKNPAAANKLWAEMVKDGVKPEAHAWSSRVHAHARAGQMKAALKVGKQMRDAGHPWCVVTYTSLITGSTKKRDYRGAWKMWKEMIMWGVTPDVMAYTAMMKLCANTHQYEMAMTFLSDMDMEDQRPSRVTMETLVRAAATAPQWIRAYGTIVDDLVERFIGLGLVPEEDTYRALMTAYGSGGDADKVLQCIEEAHVLRGHVSDLLGNGTPKLSSETYCTALDAIAKCCSVGRHRGTRPRWGIMLGQDRLVMDIGALEVPEEDADRVRQMQMAGMEWDEDGEAALKKGFRKGTRKRFMGVYTPKELVGDDEFERDIEEEYERVMNKAKRLKQNEDRQKLMLLGIESDEDENIAKTRPRVLPDPREREWIQAPISPWLPSSTAPAFPDMVSAPEGLEEVEPRPATIGVGDGRSQEETDGKAEVDLRAMGMRVNTKDAVTTDWAWEHGRPDANADDEGWTNVVPEEESKSGYGTGPLWNDNNFVKQGESEDHELETWREDLGGDSDTSEFFVPPEGGPTARPERPSGKGFQEVGGVLRRPTMLEILEGKLPLGEENGDKQEDGLVDTDEATGELVLPENMEEIMAEMRALAQQELDRRKQRHPHLRDDDDDNNDDVEEQPRGEAGWLEEEGNDELLDEDEGEEGDEFGSEMEMNLAGVDAESRDRAKLERLLAKLSGSFGGEDGVDDPENDDPERRVEANAVFDPSAGTSPDELAPPRYEEAPREDDEEESEGWTPLMHEGLRDRTVALLGVVRLLEADAMEAARREDEKMGFPRGSGGTAGPAVQATMRARLRCLTESRRCKKAIEFIEQEYPREGAKLDNKAALQIVEMYINTRGVGLAEAFEGKCRTEYGLTPDRRILGAILNARARRAYAWDHEVPHVERVLDALQQHRIKPHENELRFVRKIVDKGKLNHSWLPADPEANVKRLRLAAKRSNPVSKAYFKVVSKIRNAKYMIGSGRGKDGIQ